MWLHSQRDMLDLTGERAFLSRELAEDALAPLLAADSAITKASAESDMPVDGQGSLSKLFSNIGLVCGCAAWRSACGWLAPHSAWCR